VFNHSNSQGGATLLLSTDDSLESQAQQGLSLYVNPRLIRSHDVMSKDLKFCCCTFTGANVHVA